jgi:hypothetical protein
MCIFLAFTDSPSSVAGGVLNYMPPESELDTGAVIEYTHDCVEIVSEPRE